MPVTQKHASPISCAFWLQRVSLLSLVQPNDSCFPFLLVRLSISPCSLVGVGSRYAAFMPASRIEDQSLPWGMWFNPSPRTVGITPTLESSSGVLPTDSSGPQGQSPKHQGCSVSDQRVAPLHGYSDTGAG